MDESHTKATRQTRALLLQEILDRRSLHSVFQPIYSFEHRQILGYEALIRGPRGSLLQTPVELFDAANDEGSMVQLSIICLQTVLKSFAALRLPGKLFINLSPRVVALPGFSQERARDFLASINLKPERVIIELTEHERTLDYSHFHNALVLYRSMGFQVAIDDLGEGFASLRLWSELKPEYVKADKHFVTGIAREPVKLQFLRAMQMIAESCGTRIIAEGIESAADFKLVQEIGIACGQGYFIGAPVEQPSMVLSEQVLQAIGDGRKPVMPTPRLGDGIAVTARHFLRTTETLSVNAPIRNAIALFDNSPRVYAIPVLDSQGVAGLIARRHVRFIKRADSGQQELFDHACREIMNVAPMVVDVTLPLRELACLLSEATPQHLADGFVITSESEYIGMGSATDVLRVLNDRNFATVRYANPLTLLPGQVPINEHLQGLLAAKLPFVACQAELEPMKGFNDSEGFAKGDKLICHAGLLLREACDPLVDFAGHVYGNRFVLLLQSDGWEARLNEALARFEVVLQQFLTEEEWQRGNFLWSGRRGATEARPLPRLAIGAVLVEGDAWETRHDVLAASAAAQLRAKECAGSNLLVLNVTPPFAAAR